MSGRNRNDQANQRGFTSGHAGRTTAFGGYEATTESLAASVEAELAKAEAQLAAISHSTGEARPYEAFDFLANQSPVEAAVTTFEYDGHCPPVSGRAFTPDGKQVATQYPHDVPTEFSSANDAQDAALASRVRAMADSPNSGATSDVAAEMEVAFRHLARVLSKNVAQQWQCAARQLDETRAMVDELRDILATARHALADIQRLHDVSPRARGAGNPACRRC